MIPTEGKEDTISSPPTQTFKKQQFWGVTRVDTGLGVPTSTGKLLFILGTGLNVGKKKKCLMMEAELSD